MENKMNLKNTRGHQMKTIAFTVSVLLVLSLTGCGQLTKLLEKEIANNTTTISGVATLHNQTNHSGITVKMGKQVQTQSLGISVQTVTTSFTTVATTGASGAFSFDVTTGGTSQSLSLDTGLYTVTFSKNGYETVTVDNVPVVLGQSVYNMDNVNLLLDNVKLVNSELKFVMKIDNIKHAFNFQSYNNLSICSR